MLLCVGFSFRFGCSLGRRVKEGGRMAVRERENEREQERTKETERGKRERERER